MSHDEALHAAWKERQERLQGLLEKHGALRLDYRVDLRVGRFWWQRSDGQPVVVASARFLLSYAKSNRSILCGWENRSVAPEATVPAVPGISGHIADSNEPEAWDVAMRIANAVGAHFIYRAPSPQTLAFFGLWDVRPASEGDAPFVAGSPWGWVRDVLVAIAKHVDEGRDAEALARGYGETFVKDHLHRGTSLEAPLRSIGERLQKLAGASPEVQRAELQALIAEVARQDAM